MGTAEIFFGSSVKLTLHKLALLYVKPLYMKNEIIILLLYHIFVL